MRAIGVATFSRLFTSLPVCCCPLSRTAKASASNGGGGGEDIGGPAPGGVAASINAAVSAYLSEKLPMALVDHMVPTLANVGPRTIGNLVVKKLTERMVPKV